MSKVMEAFKTLQQGLQDKDIYEECKEQIAFIIMERHFKSGIRVEDVPQLGWSALLAADDLLIAFCKEIKPTGAG